MILQQQQANRTNVVISSNELRIYDNCMAKEATRITKATRCWVAIVLFTEPELRKVVNRSSAIKKVQDVAAQHGWHLYSETVGRELRHVINTLNLFNESPDQTAKIMSNEWRDYYAPH